RLPSLDFVFLFFWCALLFGYGINTGTLYRTEALRAIIGREVLYGSWVVPTLYGEPILTKPPGMYIAIAICSLPFGEVTAFTARLPSVLAATITVFLFFGTFHQILDRHLALIGAMLMPVSFLWLDKVPSAEIDMLQVAWVAGALLTFLRALEAEESQKLALRWWLTSLLCVAGGFLTKWTSPAFFYLTVVPLLAWRGRLSLLFSWWHLAAVGVFLGVCTLWVSAVIAEVGWPALRDPFLAEAAQRFQPNHHGRTYPWLESLGYPFQILAANLPWSLLALWSLRPAFYRSWSTDGQRLLQLLHCWTWPNLLFWSLPAQHHVRYSLPMCPGIIGLGVMVCLHWLRSRESWRVSLSVFLGAWLIVKVIFTEMIVPERTAHRHVRETAARLSELVPTGEILYLGKLKDEGILFYYNRPARRLNGKQGDYYALLIEAEWQALQNTGRAEVIEWLRDQQEARIVLVRFR
ncbi:MAG: glycosyltransferase family 39 protein, partial [Planctomycetes bacterium]|nr:glycosyltransferase family 39 protein [Planctomycetota bacterium]